MLETLCLMSSVWAAWATGQTGERGDWPLSPKWSRGQELVYVGTVKKESLSQTVRFATKEYELRIRSFVLDVRPNGAADLIFLTALKLKETGPTANAEATIRLEQAEVDAIGRLTVPNKIVPLVLLEEPSTWESGFIVEVPAAPAKVDETWTVSEDGRPARKYRVVGTETIKGTTCVKLEAEQRSDDWDKPRGDRQAWSRTDKLWIAPRTGLVHKVERDILLREGARRDPTSRLLTRYELESNQAYNAVFYQDRHREITQARELHQQLVPLLADPAKAGPKPFENLIAKIDAYISRYPDPTPYREALAHVRVLAEKGKRGEKLVLDVPAPPPPLAVGKAMPEFVVEDLKRKQTYSSRSWRGKRLLMVFYRPDAETAQDVLRFAQKLADLHRSEDVVVVGFAMTGDAETVARLEKEMRLTIPTLAGSSLRESYGVKHTPRFVFVGEDGVVRSAYEDWGEQTRTSLSNDLKKATAQLPRMP